jgi:hypothetical protein
MRSLVFIVGAPRSGTYLLLSRLNKIYNIALPVETHFMPLFHQCIFLWGDLSVRSNRARLLSDIYEFLKIWTPRSERGRDYAKIFQNSLLITEPDFEDIIDASSSYQELVDQIYQAFSKRKGRKAAGDKSAFYKHIDLNLITSSVTSAKVVHIVRDGRDVSLSWRKIFTGPETVIESAVQWSKHVLEKRHWGVNNPENYFEIRYENLIEDSDAVLAAVAGFLNLEYLERDQQIDSLGSILAAGDMHTKIAGPIVKDNKYKWRKNMPVNDLALFESYAGLALDEFNYPRSPPSAKNTADIILVLSLSFNFFRRMFSIRYWRLIVKGCLPAFIWFFSRSGISLSKITNGRKYDIPKK